MRRADILDGLEDVDRVPGAVAFRLCLDGCVLQRSGCGSMHMEWVGFRYGVSHTLLQQDHARKPVFQVPEVDARHAALVVPVTERCRVSSPHLLLPSFLAGRDSQLPVNVHTLVRAYLHLPDPVAGLRPVVIIQRRLKLIAPWAPPAVAVAVVVAKEVVATRRAATPRLEGLVDGGEEFLGQGGHDGAYCGEILGGLGRGKAAEEVAGERCC